MKFGLLPASLTASVGLTLLGATGANAALFFGSGTNGPTSFFTDVQEIPVTGPLTDGQLILRDVEFTSEFSDRIEITIFQCPAGTGCSDVTPIGGGLLFFVPRASLDANGDFIPFDSLANGDFGFSENDRESDFFLSFDGGGYDFSFSHYEIELETTEGVEANDTIEVEFASGDKATVTFSYDANAELLPAGLSPFEEGGEFIELNHISGLIEEVVVVDPEEGLFEVEVTTFGNLGADFEILEDGSRRARSRRVPSDSDVDIDLFIGPDGTACPVADMARQVVPIGEGCFDENGQLIIQPGSFIRNIEEDGSVSIELEVDEPGDVAGAGGVTTGLPTVVTPPEAIPGPSAIWGIATASALLLRVKRKSST
ncbi:MAG: hypothetical protein AAFU53_18110 [Cyanobacteria bacterium J06632_3]